MTFSLKPHSYRKQPDTDRAVLTQSNPYVRFKTLGGDDPPIYCQGGLFYYENGEEISKDKLPPWCVDELKKLSPKVRKEVGLGDGKV